MCGPGWRGVASTEVGRSWFYSDSIHDLPLLQAVTDPVAVDPDPRLRAYALQRGWPLSSLVDAAWTPQRCVGFASPRSQWTCSMEAPTGR